jgi:hypothetical protein
MSSCTCAGDSFFGHEPMCGLPVIDPAQFNIVIIGTHVYQDEQLIAQCQTPQDAIVAAHEWAVELVESGLVGDA